MEMVPVAPDQPSKSSEQKPPSQFHGQFIDLRSILFIGMSKERNQRDMLSRSLVKECIGKLMPLHVEYVLPPNTVFSELWMLFMDLGIVFDFCF
jgi:hypothetical protein